MSIQLAIDDAIDERILSNALEETGHESPAVAEDLQEVFDGISNRDTDLVITGKRFDDTSVVETAQSIRSAHDHPYIPIMVSGTQFTREEVINTIQAGVNQLILKPIDPEVLSRKISRSQRMQVAA